MAGSAAREATAVPHFIGRYEVLVPIASGGMATVYLARSRGAGGFERNVAIKLTHGHLRESVEFQSLLVEEAKLASMIHHQNVVAVLDVGDDPLGLFLVMDYVEGDTFSGLLRRARQGGEGMPRPFAMRILIDALAGLHAAHETKEDGKPLQLVHRDFSPQNILVGTDGVTKLTDFGIAKAASRVGNTSTGVLKGKIAYMSPEQARGEPLDRRADVWAAGVLAWEIIVGRSLWPRDAEDVTVLIKLVTTSPPRLRDVDASVSEELTEIVAKALALAPADRWPTAAAFSKALSALVEVADHEQLAEYVRTVAGPKIEQRREQIRAMGTLRTKMGEISEASVMTPSGIARSPSAAALHEQEDNDATEVVVTPPPSVEKEKEKEVVDAHDEPLPTKRPPKWAIPAAAAALAVGVVILIVAAVRSPSSSSSSSSSSSGPAVTQTQPPTQTTSAPSHPPVPVVTEPVVTATVVAAPPRTSTMAIATANLTATATSRAVVHTTPTARPTASSKLAPSPY